MTHRASITLDEEAFSFLNTAGAENRSAFINELLLKEKQSLLQESILKANQEESEDDSYHQDLSDWDITLEDGI